MQSHLQSAYGSIHQSFQHYLFDTEAIDDVTIGKIVDRTIVRFGRTAPGHTTEKQVPVGDGRTVYSWGRTDSLQLGTDGQLTKGRMNKLTARLSTTRILQEAKSQGHVISTVKYSVTPNTHLSYIW